MISVRLYGRAGNQAMQIAACIGAARSMGVKYIIPKETINPAVWPAYFSHLFEYRGDELNRKKLQVWRELSHAYTKIPKWKPEIFYDGILLDGYFQSQKYWFKYADEVRDLFRIPLNTLKGEVALHYRAGDFRVFSDKHPIVSEAYIRSSIQYFINKGYTRFSVFSDEIGTISSIISRNQYPDDISFWYSVDRTPLEDFYLMSSHEHGIVSNSTFSIMAQMLNRNSDKIIIRPSFFFGPGNAHLDTKDVYPENWITL